MNIIDAWKAAKEGQKIARSGLRFIKLTTSQLRDVVETLQSPDLLADDWEVMKEKKTFECMAHRGIDGCEHILFKNGTGENITLFLPRGESLKVTIEWEE